MTYESGTALVVVDVQNDFVDPAGSLSVEGAEEILPAVNREIRAANAAGVPIFYTRDWHPEQTPHFQTQGGPWPPHCIQGTWGAQFHPDLEVVEGAQFLYKGTGKEDGYSAFSVRHPGSKERHSTGLHERMQERGIRHIAVAGLTTDYCVRETAHDALDYGYRITVVEDAVRPVDREPGDGDRALEEISARGAQIEREEA
jgi:nicotinamidase/pyrazinamidase